MLISLLRRCELIRRKRCGEMLHVHTDPDICETVCVFAWIGLSYTRNLVNPLIEKAFFLVFRLALQSGLRLRPQESQWKCLRFQKYSDSREQGLNQKFIGWQKSRIIRTWVWIFFNSECSVLLFKYFVTTKEESTNLQVNVQVQLLQVIQSTSTLLLMSRSEE